MPSEALAQEGITPAKKMPVSIETLLRCAGAFLAMCGFLGLIGKAESKGRNLVIPIGGLVVLALSMAPASMDCDREGVWRPPFDGRFSPFLFRPMHGVEELQQMVRSLHDLELRVGHVR